MIRWENVSSLRDLNAINKLEEKYSCRLPSDLKECLKQNNAGTPFPYQFDIGDKKDFVFSGLLSFNDDDVDCIYDFIDSFIETDGKLKLFPFGLNPFGDFFCVRLQDDKIVMWEHEFESAFVIAGSFTEFLNMLHD